ncbi:MAG: RNA polymerase sigma-70 factor [Prolixibacteraceae bacterium]
MPELSNDTVVRFIEGDEHSFKLIFNFFYPRLYYFIHAYIPNDDLAENIVQDTFFTLWRKRGYLKHDSNINAWLYTVARNNCLKKMRGRKTKQSGIVAQLSEMELEMNMEALADVDTSGLTFREIERIVEHTLNGLPPQCRKIFQLSRFENKKNREIAQELGISVKAVENQITKALKVFKKTLKDYLPLVTHLFIS